MEEEDDKGSVSLGWAFHAVMSMRARIGWLLSRLYRMFVASTPDARIGSFERQEPHLGGRADPTLAPEADEDFEDEEEDERGRSSRRARTSQEARRARPRAEGGRQV